MAVRISTSATHRVQPACVNLRLVPMLTNVPAFLYVFHLKVFMEQQVVRPHPDRNW